MAQATRKRTEPHPLAPHLVRALREGGFFLLLAVSAYLLLSLASFDPGDPGWSHATGIPERATSQPATRQQRLWE